MFRKLAVLLISFLLVSCGIEGYYYLPQLPEINITTTSNTIAKIDFPPVSSDYSYAVSYQIYYRIYISTHNAPGSIKTATDRSNVSQSLVSDYNSFYPLTDSTNTSSLPTMNSFSGRYYYKLELEGEDIDSILSKNGGTITIQTGSGYSSASFNGGSARLLRSSSVTSPRPDYYFYNALDLLDNNNATSTINADVARHSGGSGYLYVSMYIFLAGVDPTNFSQIYSKPTHINVFKLP